MHFDIEELPKRKKKKSNNKLVYPAVFFCILTIVLLIIYIIPFIRPENNSENIIVKKKEQQKEKLKIVDLDSNERPIAVMIDNNIGNGKHAGLQDSYINYEIIVEGGLTRIMALYKDKDVDLIGPVRSSRHYFLDYALEHDAIYTHFGWSPYAENDIRNLGVNNINGMVDESPFERNQKIPAPHNVFTSTKKIRDYVEKKGYEDTSYSWEVLNYSTKPVELKMDSDENEESFTANTVKITYSPSEERSYLYNEDSKNYVRYMNGKEHLDYESNNQLHYKNIIIMRVANKTLDNEGRQDLDTVGNGNGYYITNGYYKEIRWTKSSRKSKTTFTDMNGMEIKVNDGNTFVQIVPLNSNIEIE